MKEHKGSVEPKPVDPLGKALEVNKVTEAECKAVIAKARKRRGLLGKKVRGGTPRWR